MARTPVASAEVERIERRRREQGSDLVAVEEPLQILLQHGEAHARTEAPLALTMRTPGQDRDLVTGFLFAEGVIEGVDDLMSVRHCKRSETPDNVVRAVLHERVVVPSRLLERTLTMTSACGVCGERTLEALSKAGCAPLPVKRDAFDPSVIRRALLALEESQAWFRHTGGTHGAALFNDSGELMLHREDVGRHNALDKLVGAWLAGAAPDAAQAFVLVSSRASFELVQKTVRAGFPMLVAIGAASSLAIETARRFDLTLLGFARESRFTVYSNGARVALEPSDPTTGSAFVQVEAG
jgi:FdhD protein